MFYNPASGVALTRAAADSANDYAGYLDIFQPAVREIGGLAWSTLGSVVGGRLGGVKGGQVGGAAAAGAWTFYCDYNDGVDAKQSAINGLRDAGVTYIGGKVLGRLAGEGEAVAKKGAFGFSKNLPGFKRLVPNAKNYMDLGLEPYATEFSNQLQYHMRTADRIHFDISDMTMLNGPEGVLSGPTRLNPQGSTNWELRTI